MRSAKTMIQIDCACVRSLSRDVTLINLIHRWPKLLQTKAFPPRLCIKVEHFLILTISPSTFNHHVASCTKSRSPGAPPMQPPGLYHLDTFRHPSTKSINSCSKSTKLRLRVEPKERHRQRREHHPARSEGVH